MHSCLCERNGVEKLQCRERERNTEGNDWLEFCFSRPAHSGLDGASSIPETTRGCEQRCTKNNIAFRSYVKVFLSSPTFFANSSRCKSSTPTSSNTLRILSSEE